MSGCAVVATSADSGYYRKYRVTTLRQIKNFLLACVLLSATVAYSFAESATSPLEVLDSRSKSHGISSEVPPLKRSADKVRVAVVQMLQVHEEELSPGQTTVDLLLPWIQKANLRHADLVVFPEYLMGQFHIPDQRTEQLCQAAREHRINVIVGGWEILPGEKKRQPPKPGTYSNTLLVVDREGKIVGKHRKMHSAVGAGSPYCWPPEPGEQGEHTMVKGTANEVVDLDFGRIGLLTCYDGYFFESFQMPSLRGAEVLIWVNARQGMVEPHIIQAASFITCTHVVASNQAVGCGSAICSYPGWKLDEAAREPEKETMIVGDLDLAEIRHQRLNNRMFHQRRPKIYQTITQDWRPWEAYPNLQPFRHESSTTVDSSSNE